MVTATGSKSAFPICDAHTHILPGVDDGCKTAEESLSLLRQSAAQGVRGIFATPHFNPGQTVGGFLAGRAAAAEKLRLAYPGEEELPPFVLGAEVAYYPGLQDMADLPKLCLGSTPYMLLEMPFFPWSQRLLRDVEALQSYFGVHLIIAHIDRYLSGQDGEIYRRFLQMDVLFQMNAEAVLSPRTARKARHLVKDGYISLLGSDCHDPQQRPQRLGAAVEKLCAWHLDDRAERIASISCALFEDAAAE